MSCWMIALQRAGIPVWKYFASEIDKYAIQISKKNFPEIVHIWDVTKFDDREIIYTADHRHLIKIQMALTCWSDDLHARDFLLLANS